MHIHQERNSRAQRGFTLVEALISLVVMAFGMLALSGMQASLARNSDLAKQRTEAMRLAQARLEKMRSFTGISTGAVNWNGLDSMAPGTATTNATYTVTSSVTGLDTDSFRPVTVVVSWIDRTNATQNVSLASVISQTDPKDPGFLGNPLPQNTPLRRPKNRNINIPIPATDLNNGTSAVAFSNTQYVVFSNVTGNVVKVCNPNKANATAAEILASACVSFAGYVLDGYVGTSAAYPTGVDFSQVVLNLPLVGQPVFCVVGGAVNQNSGVAIPGYKYYSCVIPLSGGLTWGGTVRLAGVPTTGSDIVCRYQYTPTLNTTVNERNVQPYVNVNQTLDEQNYLMATSNSNVTTSLAGSTTTCPAAMTVAGVSIGVVHQDCRLKNTSRAAECP